MSDDPESVVCPGCGAVATMLPNGWLDTAHERNCSWLGDPDSEPYPSVTAHDRDAT